MPCGAQPIAVVRVSSPPPSSLPPVPLQVTGTSLLLHYHSVRPALWPIVVGVLKGASQVGGWHRGVARCFCGVARWSGEHYKWARTAPVIPALQRLAPKCCCTNALHHHMISVAVSSCPYPWLLQKLFGHDVELELVRSREAGDCDHEVRRRGRT